jgi:hypothetical protein
VNRFISNLLIATFVFAFSASVYALTPTTKIKDLLDHPRDFENRQITLNGTVTNAVSLLLIKYYEIEDGSGTIKVITDKLLPARGEKLTVTGRMIVVELGTERLIMLRENPADPGQTAGSPYVDNSP